MIAGSGRGLGNGPALVALAGCVVAVVAGAMVWGQRPRTELHVSGPTADVVKQAAEVLTDAMGSASVMVLGEDHRSALPDAVGAAMLVLRTPEAPAPDATRR